MQTAMNIWWRRQQREPQRVVLVHQTGRAVPVALCVCSPSVNSSCTSAHGAAAPCDRHMGALTTWISITHSWQVSGRCAVSSNYTLSYHWSSRYDLCVALFKHWLMTAQTVIGNSVALCQWQRRLQGTSWGSPSLAAENTTLVWMFTDDGGHSSPAAPVTSGCHSKTLSRYQHFRIKLQVKYKTKQRPDLCVLRIYTYSDA